MPTRIPKDFQVTDDHRRYCTDRGWPLMLPDVFIKEFKEYWENRKDTKARKSNWNLTFTNWIKRASPMETTWTGRWEKYCERAKALENKPRVRQPVPYHPKELKPAIDIKQAAEAAKAKLRSML